MEAEMARKKATLFAVHEQHVPENRVPENKVTGRAKPRRPKMLRLTLRDSFAPELCPRLNTDLNLERSLRSIALLLNTLTEDGNKPLDGSVAKSFGDALRTCADYVEHTAGRNDKYEGPCLQSV
jgi:hypothetical protein